MLAAVTKNGLAVQYATSRLQNNYTIASTAVQQNGDAIHLVSHEMKKRIYFDLFVDTKLQLSGSSRGYLHPEIWSLITSFIPLEKDLTKGL